MNASVCGGDGRRLHEELSLVCKVEVLIDVNEDDVSGRACRNFWRLANFICTDILDVDSAFLMFFFCCWLVFLF